MAEGSDGGESGKAFRSLSVPPSRMPLRTYMWLLDPTIYIYTTIHVRSRKFFLADAQMHVYSQYIRYMRTSGSKLLLSRISKRCSKQLKAAF